mgnify:CR=1 FL=1
MLRCCNVFYTGLTRTKNELGRNEDFMRLYQQLTDMFSDTCQTSANGNLHKSRTGQYFPFRDRMFTFCVKETLSISAQFVDAGSYTF